MIELPEAETIARQIDNELHGRQVLSCTVLATPHKFAFTNRPIEDYTQWLTGRRLAKAAGDGRGRIVLSMDEDWLLVLEEIAGKVRFHAPGEPLPAKHQLLLNFTNGAALTVTLAMWGAIRLLPCASPDPLASPKVPPLSSAFTFEYFESLFDDPEESEAKSAKAFLISKPGIGGVANGCTQDILFNARIHPKRRIITLSAEERRVLYDELRATLEKMATLGGRDSERDLYGQQGGYHCILGSHSVGNPCPRCGTSLEKIQFLGGAAYFCSSCQV